MSAGAIKTYYRLTKPGIIYGNALAAAAGFLLASTRGVDLWLLAAMLIGTSLVIASACVLNNYVDRDIDAKMARTKKRALVSGRITGRNAIIFASILGSVGFIELAIFTNWLTVAVGFLGMFAYVVLYGIGKRRTIHGTLIGTISGSTPPVAGYVAATNRVDAGAIILFLILVTWQMPHFYSIAMYRFADYKAAGLPVWPVKRGMRSTKKQIVFYICAFIVTVAALSIYGSTGYIFLCVMALIGLVWLGRGLQGFKAVDDAAWARRMFGFSLIALLVLCSMLSVGARLP